MQAFAISEEPYFLHKRSRVVVHREVQQGPIGQHRHNFTEIALVIGGGAVHVTGSHRQEIARGDVLVMTGQRAHGYEKPEGLHLVNVLIRHSLLSHIGRDLGSLPGYHALFGAAARKRQYVSHLRLPDAELSQVEDWAVRLESESSLTTQEGYVLAEAYLTLMLGVMCRRYGRVNSDRMRPFSRLSATVSYLEGNFGKPIAIADLAERTGMSERTFFREFQKVFGETPAQFLLKVRLRHAAGYLSLRGSELRVGEIAQRCGFGDSNYFSRVFRWDTGLSPREYRVRSLREKSVA